MKRRTPLPKRRATPRRRLAGCPIRGCHRAPYRRDRANNLCRIHLVEALDRMARAKKMSEGDNCESGRPRHAGVLQWAHCLSRRYTATRWMPLNSVRLCAGCHEYFTRRPDEWAAWMDENLGAAVVQELRRLAFAAKPPDLADEYDRLDQWVEAVRGKATPR